MKRHLIRGFRFGVTGVANTGIHALVAYLCLNGFFLGFNALQAGPVAANGIAFTVATIFSYVVNTLWSFSTQISRKTLRRFSVVALVGLLAAMLTARVGEVIGLPPMGGVLLVIFVLPLVNFGLHSIYTYR